MDTEEFAKHFELRPEIGQKGVDTLIVLDLVRLAQQVVYDTAVLIAGDRDLAAAVATAQDSGRRVIVALPAGASLARELRHLADEVTELRDADLRTMITPRDSSSD